MRSNGNKIVKLLFTVIITLLTQSCIVYPAVSFEGSKEGIVLDIENKQPVENVLVVGAISETHSSYFNGSSTGHLKKKYSITNHEGKYSIPSMVASSFRIAVPIYVTNEFGYSIQPYANHYYFFKQEIINDRYIIYVKKTDSELDWWRLKYKDLDYKKKDYEKLKNVFTQKQYNQLIKK